MDTSLLLNYLSSYIFPTSAHRIVTNLVLGVSLGGHAAWQCLLHDSRITSAIVVIGCPDYVRLMTDRARLSRLETWNDSKPPGADFIGSRDFPPGLVEAIEQYDPAGLLLGRVASRRDDISERSPTEEEKSLIMPIMKHSLQGKRILNLAGGADKLVPYKCSEPFMRWLKNATKPHGWFSDGGVEVENIVFDGIGHEMSPGMVREVHRFVLGTLDEHSDEATSRKFKI